ncbi:MAG: sigma-54 dependent transcriptional regulator [Bacteroidota bacterium]|jgi:DNA-binding NtrC family response regulator|nr:sigma-54 dependent transcriptional regulator [Bacteroidota bacterium]
MAFESLSGKHYHIFLISSAEGMRRDVARFLDASTQFELSCVSDPIELLAHPDAHPDIVILDPFDQSQLTETIENLQHRLVDVPVLVLLDEQSEFDIDWAERLGLFVGIQTPLRTSEFRGAIRAAERIRELREEIRRLQSALTEEVRLEHIIARSAVMHNVMMLVRKASANDINILLEGEEGTGKELIARAIHFNGPRAGRPFSLLNCASLPQHLIERELYGSEAGVFGEGSEFRPGIFEQAEGGTLLIAEIGAMDVLLQARLYRTMQTRSFRRIGGDIDIPIDVRIITATSRDLRAMCGAGTFREDLYFRLASFPIKLPPLRDRPADIPHIVETLLRRIAEKEGRPGLGINPATLQVLRRYRWPGNLPEIEYCMERAVTLCESMELMPDDLPANILVATGMTDAGDPKRSGQEQQKTLPTMEQLKARGVRLALEASAGNIKEAARLLDIGRTTMYKLMEKYHIEL